MIEVNQKRLHDPANGVTGDCFSAVLASLLHMDIDDVPLFVDPETWCKDLNAWLRPHGMAFIMFSPDFFDTMPIYGVTGIYHDISGISPRFPDDRHACVGLDGKLIFDPHPTKLGLPKIESHGLFVCLEPWRMVNSSNNVVFLP